MSAAFPGPSDNLRTHDVLSDSLRLTWNAPASAVPVLGYQVSAQAGGTSGFLWSWWTPEVQRRRRT